MSSEAVPIIDLSPLFDATFTPTSTPSAAASACVAAIDSAFRTWGIFQASSPLPSSALSQELVRALSRFFALPEEKKRALDLRHGGWAWRGYMPFKGEATKGRHDQKEGFYGGPEHNGHELDGLPTYGKNQFPDQDVPEMRPAVLEYTERVTELGCMLCDAMSLALGLDKDYIRGNILDKPDPVQLFRSFHYIGKENDGKEDFGIGEHSGGGLEWSVRNLNLVRSPLNRSLYRPGRTLLTGPVVAMDSLPLPPPRHPASHSRSPSFERALPPPPKRYDQLSAPRSAPSRPPPIPPKPHSPSLQSPMISESASLPIPPVTAPLALPTSMEASAFGIADEQDEEEDDMEYIAGQVASQTEPDDPWAIPGVEAYAGSLRRSLTRRTTKVRKKNEDSSSMKSDESRLEEEVEDAKLRKAVEVLEDEEVAAFLARVGKQVQEVRVAVPKGDIPFPEISSFRNPAGATDWIAFCKAYLETVATLHTPPSLLAPPPPSRLHVTVTRSYLERLYVILPPQSWESIIKSDIGSIWRWESPRTRYYCLTYAVLWYVNLIPLLFPATFLYYILRSRFFPPTADEILAQARDRVRRTAEAAELSSQLHATGRLGFLAQGARGAAESARGFLGGLRSEAQENALARGLEGSMLGGMMLAAGGTRAAKPVEREIPRTSALARAIAGTSGVAGGVVGHERVSIDELRPPAGSATDMESGGGPDPESKSKTTTLYGTTTELLRVFGPPMEEYLGQASDLAEKVKNLLVHPDHPAVEPVCLRLAAICCFLLLCPTWLFYKGAWFYLGLEFFALWKLREMYPEWRRALMPWWVLLGAPTDAEFATYILQRRSRANKPLRGQKTLKRQARKRARGETIHEPSTPSSTTTFDTSSALGTSLAATGLGIAGTHSRTPSILESPATVVGTYFALHHATPGSLTITSTGVTFVPSRGFKTIGLNRLSKRFSRGGGNDISDTDSVASFENRRYDDSNLRIDVRMEDVTAVKKEKRLGFEGLQITARDGKSWRLTNVARRDDAFNKLVAISPAVWQQS
ncbi:hypothetical protein P7C70_g1348, partial [Phenoliferia sp. Uapishka_3]